jgi:succinate dehydrogenase / fumarate reductase flavoprotein subunit
MFEKIVKEAFYLSDQDLVQQYVDYSGRAVHELIEWGRRARQLFYFTGEEGNYVTSGKALGLACRQGVKETPGVKVMNDVMIQDILVNEGRVVGAVGVNVYTGEIVAFRTKAVVLGTGGYQPYSFKCTVSDMTGDGMAMAYRAGAQLADMEFNLLAPGILVSPRVHRGSIFAGFLFLAWNDAAPWPKVVRNTDGELVEDKIPEALMELARKSEAVKLIYNYYWGKEISAGKATPNKGLYVDWSTMSEEDFQQGTRDFQMIMRAWYRKPWHFQGGDFTDLKEMMEKGELWELGISNEYSMGGIAVDAEMRTKVPGLFAAGEVTSGVFGANRIRDATTEMVVQGFRAGESAAEYIEGADEPRWDDEKVAEVRDRILGRLERDKGIEPVKVHRAIEKTADEGFGFLRDQAGLSATLKEIERIRNEDAPRMKVTSRARAYNHEWIEALQVDNLLICTEAGVRAALMRKESRGFHIRSDYPQVDHDNYLVKIVAADKDSEMDLSIRKPRVTRMKLPTGQVENVMKYTLENIEP